MRVWMTTVGTFLFVAGVLTGGFTSEELKAAGCDVVLGQIRDLEDHLTRLGN